MTECLFSIACKYRVYEDSVIKTNNSTIYKAQDLVLQRDVCIKEIDLQGKEQNKEDNYKKAMSEVRSLIKAREKTSFIPMVYHTYNEDNKLYIIMEWIEGKGLDKFIQGKKAIEFEFIDWMEQLCRILLNISRQRPPLYHKDIKPNNIIISSEKRKLFLIDFNISDSLPNKIEGTKQYKAPEMEESNTVKRDKVDVFAMGVILYQYYTGIVPEKGKEYGNKSKRNIGTDWDYFKSPKEINPDIFSSMDNIIQKCMEKDYDKRYSIDELFRRIKDYKWELKNEGKKQAKNKNGVFRSKNE